MKIEIMQYNENKEINHYILGDVDGGGVILISNGKKIVFPISEIAGVRSVIPFYDMPEKEMEIQRKNFIKLFKELEKINTI